MMIAAIAAAVAVQAAGVILPGHADLALVDGSTPTACPDMSAFGAEFQPRGQRECVETGYDDIDRVAESYIAALRRDGWRLAGGAGPQYWIQRATPSGECEQIDLTGLPGEMLGRPAERALLIFEHRAPARCLEDRS